MEAETLTESSMTSGRRTMCSFEIVIIFFREIALIMACIDTISNIMKNGI